MKLIEFIINSKQSLSIHEWVEITSLKLFSKENIKMGKVVNKFFHFICTSFIIAANTEFKKK